MVDKQTKTPKTAFAKKRRSLIISIVLAVAGLVLIGISLFRLYDWRQVTTATDAPPTQEIVIEDTVEPSENKPDGDNYEVSADQPRKIILPTINSDGNIQKVGLNDKNAIAVPSNIYFAGWYTGSIKPGELGLSVIDGHVSGRYNDGIFKNLSKLNTGDTFSVEYGDRSMRNFEVVEVKTMPESESAQFLLTKDPAIERQLNLITCGGQFNNGSQTYQDRVVVVARAI